MWAASHSPPARTPSGFWLTVLRRKSSRKPVTMLWRFAISVRSDRTLIAKRQSIVTGFLELLRRNTVSQNPEGVRAGGEWLAAHMRGRGLEARVLETGGGPAVFGERRVPGAVRTVLIYCHYDTKPAPPKEWFQPSPFEP